MLFLLCVCYAFVCVCLLLLVVTCWEKASLGPVVNILAIFSDANILNNKLIKIYHIKGFGWLSVIDCD